MTVNKRPSPQRLKALKLDIKHKYQRQSRKAAERNGRSRGMSAIRLSELTRWMEDAYGAGAELPMDKNSYAIARIFAHHIGALDDFSARIRTWMGTYAPWVKPLDLERLINETQECPLRWKSDTLAWKLKLTDAKRSELRIRTIGAIDCSKEQRAERRRKDAAERQKARRAAKRLTRTQHIDL